MFQATACDTIDHMARGKIILPNGLIPEKHELITANSFTSIGIDVEFIAPNRTKGARTPDIRMGDLLWEIKAPRGNSGRTLDDTIKRALKQSTNIIIDLRRTKLDDKQCEKSLKTNKNLVRGVKRLKIITKRHKVIDILA